MTREEAITELQRMTDTIEWDYPLEAQIAIEMAVAALRDAQARQEGCISCKNRFWYFTDYRFNPNYCPSCGRDLDGATAEQSSGVEGGQL